MQEYDGRADVATVTALRRIAVHVLARARHQASGRFSLRVAPGGFGTPDLPDGRRVRVAGPTLVVESDAPDAATSRSMAIPRASLAGLAHLAGVRLATPLDVGADTPTTGPIGVPIVIDPDGITAICRWFELSAGMLDRVVAGLPHKTARPSLVRLWPEHFDVAVDLLARDGVRTNIGASPGDGFIDEPYLYVGPWTADRPGGGAFWNAPFGAAMPASSLTSVDDGVAFLREGIARLATNWPPPAV